MKHKYNTDLSKAGIVPPVISLAPGKKAKRWQPGEIDAVRTASILFIYLVASSLIVAILITFYKFA